MLQPVWLCKGSAAAGRLIRKTQPDDESSTAMVPWGLCKAFIEQRITHLEHALLQNREGAEGMIAGDVSRERPVNRLHPQAGAVEQRHGANLGATELGNHPRVAVKLAFRRRVEDAVRHQRGKTFVFVGVDWCAQEVSR